MAAIDYAIVGMVAVGAFFGLVAAIGLVRLPDVFTRTHAASKSDTLAAVLALAGVALAIGTDTATLKALFLLFFMFLTNPTAAHAIARAAADQDIEPWTRDGHDDVQPWSRDGREDVDAGGEP